MQETITSTTDYHAKLLAYELTRRRASDSSEKLAVAVAGAQVDLNPHQVDAALFAFASPLSKGALLADEVGLGKTIEAGLVLSQRWAERKRRILVITPSNLRKQWHQELNEKVLPAVPDTRSEVRTTTPSRPASSGPSTALTASSSALTSSRGTRRRTSTPRRGIWS